MKRKNTRSDSVLWRKPLYQENSIIGNTKKTPPKTSTTHRLRTDLGRSVGVKTGIQLVLKPVYGYPTFPLTTKAVSSNWKIAKRLRHRQYDHVIIERMIGLVLGTSTTFHRPFLKLCTLTYKEMGTIWRTLTNSPQRQQDLDPRPCDCYSKLLQPLDLCSLTLGPSTALSSGYHYIFLILRLYLYNHSTHFYYLSDWNG